MDISIQTISINKHIVLVNGYPIESFDRLYEAEALMEQLLILGEDVIEDLFS